MSFGYDAAILRWRGTSRNSISRHAKSLLSDLQTARKDNPDVSECVPSLEWYASLTQNLSGR
jgi:hypothetical protein